MREWGRVPPASRVRVVPPAVWDEDRLVNAARAYAPTRKPIRPGDAVGDLVVVAVEPEPGATLADETEIVLVPTPPRSDAALVDLVILLDVSESMAIPWDATHTRLDAARASLSSFVSAPNRSVASVTLIEYAKDARVVAGPVAPADLRVAADHAPKGPSATARGLDAALTNLAARLAPDRAQVILLLTDGVGEVTDLLMAAERAGRLKVPVHSIVFAPAVDDVFETLAKLSGGSFQRAAYPLTIEFEHVPGG